MEGDEGRYYSYAGNLLHGFYSPKGEVYLWNGPGYPILLMPFVALKIPLICIKFLNALFHYLSVVLLYKTLIRYTTPVKALIFSLFWACYYIAFKEMGRIYTESFTIFLITAFQYYLVLTYQDAGRSRRHLWIAGFLLGYIILTKVIFGYVVIAALIIIALVTLFSGQFRSHSRKALVILAVALLANLPYLFYTYHLTGKLLYWANSGGSSLYWASSPFEGEFGDWNDDNFTAYCDIDPLLPCNAAFFVKNHAADFRIFNQYKGVERDEAFKKKAIENIRLHPVKYLKNCVANVGRMFFDVPYSYNYERFQTFLRIPVNAIVFTFVLFSGIFTVIGWRKVKFEMLFLLLLLGLFFSFLVLVSATQRLFYVIVPVILYWTAYMVESGFDVRIRLSGKGG
jgi:4-amino-4-deoxy-L-arabinose transferase-like glycosyltransferase